MQFTFNAVDLYVVTINSRPWARTKEVSKVLKYNKKLLISQKPFAAEKTTLKSIK